MKRLPLFFLAAGLCASQAARADTYVFKLNVSNDTNVLATSNSTLTITDVSSGKVEVSLVIDSATSTSGKITEVGLNLASALGTLTYTAVTPGVTTTSYAQGNSFEKLDGDGYYDIRVGDEQNSAYFFPSTNTPQPFPAEMAFTLEGTGLSAASFLSQSSKTESTNTLYDKSYYAGIHLMTFNAQGQSVWLFADDYTKGPPSGAGESTPLPSAALAGMSMLGGLGLVRRRSR